MEQRKRSEIRRQKGGDNRAVGRNVGDKGEQKRRRKRKGGDNGGWNRREGGCGRDVERGEGEKKAEERR